jgi:hypothetical protein
MSAALDPCDVWPGDTRALPQLVLRQLPPQPSRAHRLTNSPRCDPSWRRFSPHRNPTAPRRPPTPSFDLVPESLQGANCILQTHAKDLALLLRRRPLGRPGQVPKKASDRMQSCQQVTAAI